jgi:hypothetical protein
MLIFSSMLLVLYWYCPWRHLSRLQLTWQHMGMSDTLQRREEKLMSCSDSMLTLALGGAPMLSRVSRIDLA